ncbi:MAG: malto-oligosyltrehalose trehalohydrolase [Elusimicrobia bacterium]|nr:malto-oligosyltrehalose trehalohydrolase [Elusimicrobiota bacterium]
MPAYAPRLGAVPIGAGRCRFRVWAPEHREVLVHLLGAMERAEPLRPEAGGCHSAVIADVPAGTRYLYRLPDGSERPDPASRFQPEGVHGPSEVLDPGAFAWTDAAWTGIPPQDLVIYELHVGTFSPSGSYRGVANRMQALKDLGITAVELMPVADFPGRRNWGYDGVDLFAPARCYGRPDDLRALVDAAHGLGLAVFLDVVYNHLGPDGAYLAAFSPHYYTDRHQCPWGAGVDLDGPRSREVREFFIANALHWVHEYHMDGLRFDAPHALADGSPEHLLQELAARVRDSLPARRVHLIAEDNRNLAAIVRAQEEGGWGLDGVWSDDFHHIMRRCVAGDHEGYYQDFQGTVAELAEAAHDGWLYKGRPAPHFGGPRGTDPSGIPPWKFICCIQNHDQVGNRAFGERLHHQIEPAAFRAAAAVCLLAPQSPLLFMGQEWAASNPFLYFTDHNPELGRLVTEGRRKEFQAFSAFRDPKARARIPDPQADETFSRCVLRWDEAERPGHREVLALHRALLAWRRVSRPGLGEERSARALGREGVCLEWRSRDGSRWLLMVRLVGSGPLALGSPGDWRTAFTTEEPAFADDGQPPRSEPSPDGPTLGFRRPGAALLRR